RRLKGLRRLVVCERNREVDLGRGLTRERCEQFFVAPYERRLGDDADGVAEFKTDFETAARQFVVELKRDVRVGREGEDERLPFPRRSHELLTKQLGCAHFGDDLRLEVCAGTVAEILVRRAAEAVTTGVRAAAVAVD